MSRDLPSGYGDMLEQKVFPPVILVELEWPGGALYFWNGYGNINWDSKTFVGTGTMGSISEITESRDGGANGLTLSLSGIPVELTIDALAPDSQGQPARVWLAGLTKEGAFVCDPYLFFDGFIDVCPIDETNPQDCIISVKLEKELIDRRLNNRRNTHEDQQIEYPGDMFFSFVAGLQDKEIPWGRVITPATGLPPGAVYPTANGLQRFE